jgi:alpha-L-fucosidase
MMFYLANQVFRHTYMSFASLVFLLVISRVSAGAPSGFTENSGMSSNASSPESVPAPVDPHLQWWKEARFGMFIHWGPVALSGGEIGWSRSNTGPRFPNYGHTPAAEYDKLYLRFNPVKFDAKQWVDIAKRNGMKYLVLTVVHHDGFLLWDSKASAYNIMNTPFGRDVVAELAVASREAGIRFCIYYSVPDWHDPDCRDPVNNPRYVERMNAQLTEVLTKYGKIPLIFFDYDGFPSPADPVATAALARKLSPGVILSNRLDVIDTDESHGTVLGNGDYATPEQFVGSYGDQLPWETNMTIGDQWSFKPNDRIKDARKCIEILLATIGGDGNLLLNVGPTPEGDIEERQVKVLDEVGAWVNANREAIYATRGGPFVATREYASTRTADAIYVHAMQLRSGTVRLPPLPVKISSARTLDGGAEVEVRQSTSGVQLVVPEGAQRKPVTVIKLTLAEGSPMQLAPIYAPSRSGSFAYRKPVEFSSAVAPQFMHNGAAVVDDDDKTYWTPGRAPGAFDKAWRSMIHYRSKEAASLWLHSGTLTVDLQQPQTVARVVLKEKIDGRYAPVTKWRVECEVDGAWKPVVSGERIGAFLSEVFAAPVRAQKFRLTVEADGRPAIAEFQLLPDVPALPQQGAIDRWRDMRFGMFIHWGPVSLKGTEIGWSRGAEVPIAEYDQLYKQFNPTQFDADEWVKIAKAAGMKYVVLTTKHHDGFCLWDTKQSDHNIMRTPFQRDVTRELADACKRHGLGFGTYYSTCDWHHPNFPLGSPGGSTLKSTADLDAYNRFLDAQVKELITEYGPLVTMWFDVPQEFDEPRGQAVINRVRALQPDILVNDRTGARGDFATPEQYIGEYRDDRPWETNMTLCQQWAWKPNDKMKSLEECLHTLARTVGGDGNFLFNVGPTPEGVIEARQADRLREMGEWLRTYGPSIYGTRGGPWKPTGNLVSTRRDRTVYVHVLKWPTSGTVTLPALDRKVESARVFAGKPVSVVEKDGRWTIDVPADQRHSIDTIIELTLDRSAMELQALKGD